MIYFTKECDKINNGFTIQTNAAWDWSFHFRYNNTLRTIRKRGDHCKRNNITPKWYYRKLVITNDDVLCGQLFDRFGWVGVDSFRMLQKGDTKLKFS